jgi:putative transposase
MTANQAAFPIEVMCAALGVSRSGFYAWRARRPSARANADVELADRIKAIHQRSDGTYGAPRIHAELADVGVRLGGSVALAGCRRAGGPRCPGQAATPKT